MFACVWLETHVFHNAVQERLWTSRSESMSGSRKRSLLSSGGGGHDRSQSLPMTPRLRPDYERWGNQSRCSERAQLTAVRGASAEHVQFISRLTGDGNTDLCSLCVCDVRLRNILSVVGPDALKKSRRDEERAKRSQEEVSTRTQTHRKHQWC